MKLKCNDGMVRTFEISEDIGFVITEGRCVHCGELFGKHDTKILKPLFKKHSCKGHWSIKCLGCNLVFYGDSETSIKKLIDNHLCRGKK